MIALDGTTLIVAALVGGVTLAVGWKRPFLMLSVLLLGAPLRDFFTRWLNVRTELSITTVTALGRWWFAVVLALLVVAGVRWGLARLPGRREFRPDVLDLLLLAMAVWGSLLVLLAPNLDAALSSWRSYLQPVGVFLIARELRPSARALRTLLACWLVLGALMAAYGLWQGATWTEDTYRAEGYVRQDGSLVVPPTMVRGSRFIRPASTVSGPNELGVDMVLLTVLAVLSIPAARPAGRVGLASLASLYTLCLGVTFSRSAMLAGAAAGAGVALLVGWRARRLRSVSSVGRRWAALAISGALVLAVGVALYALGVFSVLASTVANLTSEFHYLDTTAAIRHLLANPGGVGMGLVEPKGAASQIQIGGLYHVEGSLFQIAEEMGLWGLALWLAFWTLALRRIARSWAQLSDAALRVYSGTAFAGWSGALVAFVFLPLMQSISLMVWLWFLLGIGLAAPRIKASWPDSTRRADAASATGR